MQMPNTSYNRARRTIALWKQIRREQSVCRRGAAVQVTLIAA
ncbi:MAG: hypothetical protein ACI9G1_001569 [Pirellulaceae bacterium]|jgi:hypothetical protein